MGSSTRATIDDLYRVEGKAELVNGELVLMAPTGALPARVGFAATRGARALMTRHPA